MRQRGAMYTCLLTFKPIHGLYQVFTVHRRVVEKKIY